jgi:hypothetical protein
VSPGGVLGVYCGYHFIRRGSRNKFLMRFQEYMSSGPALGVFPVASLADSRIELFEDPNLQGEPLLLLSGQARIDDLDTVQVQGRPLANRISSVRCLIPPGFAFVLYRDFNQKGPNPLVLAGGTPVIEIPDLATHGFGDTARSCAVIALRAAEGLEGATWVRA